MAVQNPGELSKSAREELALMDAGKLTYDVEQGSAFRLFDRLFGEWDDGRVFEYDWSALDMRKALRKDGKMKGLEQALVLPVLSAPWKILPGDDSAQAKQIAEELETYLRKGVLEGGMSTPFQQVIAQATGARSFKKAFFEKVYKTDGGKVWYDKIAYRPPETCRVAHDAKTGAYMGYRQTPVRMGASSLSDTDDIDVQPPYAWVHINGQRSNPVSGESDLQVALWCHETKMKIMYLWTTFLATQAEPRTVVSGPEPDEAARKVATLKGGGVVGIPTAVSASVLESNGTAAQVFKDMIQYLDTQASASLLAGFTDLTSGASGTGSYALSKDQSSFFVQSLSAYAQELEESITHNVLGDLVVFNYGRTAVFPKFKFGPLAEADLDKCIALISSLAVATNSIMPFEFVEELALKTAQYLELDVDKVRDGMVNAAKVADQKTQMGLQSQQQGIAGQAAAAKAGAAGGALPPGAAGVGAAVKLAAAAVAAKKKAASGGSAAAAK
jgi:Protein of unknown function (DUF935)